MGICQSVEVRERKTTCDQSARPKGEPRLTEKSEDASVDVPVSRVPDSLVGDLKKLRDVYRLCLEQKEKINHCHAAILAILDELIMSDHSTVTNSERQYVQNRAARLRNTLPRFVEDPLAPPECLCEYVKSLLRRIDTELRGSAMTEERGAELALEVTKVLPRFVSYTKSSPALVQDAEKAFAEARNLKDSVANIRARTEAFEAQERAV